MATTLIDQYEVMYSANTFVPRIWLMNRGKFIGQLIFEPDDVVKLPDDKVTTNGQVNLYYHLKNYENCIDLLRNESPVYLLFSGTGTGFENGIITASEPVGEGEKAIVSKKAA